MLHISMYINNHDSAQILRETILAYLRASKSVSTLRTYHNIRKCIEEDDADIYIIDFSEAQTGKKPDGTNPQKNFNSCSYYDKY